MDIQTCTLCKEQKKSFWCKACTSQEIYKRRSSIHKVWNVCAVIEKRIEKILQETQQHHEINRKKEEAKIKRKRLRQLIKFHTQRIDEDARRISVLRNEHASRRIYIQKCSQLLDMKNNLVKTRIPHITTQLNQDLKKINIKLNEGNHKLIKKLLELYVIKRKNKKNCTICDLPLCDNMTDEAQELFEMKKLIDYELSKKSDAHINDHIPCSCGGCWSSCNKPNCALHLQYLCRRSFSALGYIVFVLSRIACYLSVNLPHKMNFKGSQSKIKHKRTNQKVVFSLEGKLSSPETFQTAICLLDDNIYYLARRINFNILGLKPRHLLPNLLILTQTICANHQVKPHNTMKMMYQHECAQQSINYTQSQQLTQPHNIEYLRKNNKKNYKVKETFPKKVEHSLGPHRFNVDYNMKNMNNSLTRQCVQNLQNQIDVLNISGSNSDLGSITESSLTNSSDSTMEENKNNIHFHSNLGRSRVNPFQSVQRMHFHTGYPHSRYTERHHYGNVQRFSIPVKSSISSDEWSIIDYGLDYPSNISPR